MTSSITTGWKKANATAPAINVVESDKDYKVEVAVPGMTKEDFNIHLGDENELVISMEKKVENEDKENKNTYDVSSLTQVPAVTLLARQCR